MKNKNLFKNNIIKVKYYSNVTLSHDLISYYLEQYFTKSTDCTYLSLLFLMAYLFNTLNLIHLFVGNRLFFIISLKRFQPSALLSSYYFPICWKMTFFNSILLGIGYSLIALQLQANDWVILHINFSQVNSFIQSLRFLEPLCGG